MRKLGIFILAVSLLGLGAPSTIGQVPDEFANGIEYVTHVGFAEATHLEVIERDGNVYALAGSRSPVDGGVRIIDVTDPANPVETAYIPCIGGRNQDPQMSPDGNYLVVALDSGSSCMTPFGATVTNVLVVDVSDLANPVVMLTPSSLRNIKSPHTAVFHPIENIVYLSNQETPDRVASLEIVDLRMGVHSPTVTSIPMPRVGSGPHDTNFSPDGTRAFVSAVTASYILDTTDPVAPTVISHILGPDIGVHHESLLHPSGRYLLVTDETVATSSGGTPICPGGGVHVFDLGPDRELEAAPVQVGVFWPVEVLPTVPVPPPSEPSTNLDSWLPECTSHEGNYSPDGNRLSLGWYGGGARLFDTSMLNADLPAGAPVAITEIGSIRSAEINDWSVKIHPTAPDHLIATNQLRGLDIYRITL